MADHNSVTIWEELDKAKAYDPEPSPIDRTIYLAPDDPWLLRQKERKENERLYHDPHPHEAAQQIARIDEQIEEVDKEIEGHSKQLLTLKAEEEVKETIYQTALTDYENARNAYQLTAQANQRIKDRRAKLLRNKTHFQYILDNPKGRNG